MTKKSKAVAKVSPYPRSAVPVVEGRTEKETWRHLAETMTSSELAANRVIRAVEHKSGIDEHIDVPELLKTLRAQAKAVNDGDMKLTESMLINQATSLQSLFARLTEKAMSAELMPQFEGFMRMALRAQSQCRTTLETLATIKNPPIVYAKQANIAQGHQQVNNTTSTREFESEPNQLSGVSNELCPNRGAPRAATTDDSSLEALGEINRPKV